MGKETEHIENIEHKHHWLLNSPGSNGVTHGVCKICHKEYDFDPEGSHTYGKSTKPEDLASINPDLKKYLSLAMEGLEEEEIMNQIDASSNIKLFRQRIRRLLGGYGVQKSGTEGRRVAIAKAVRKGDISVSEPQKPLTHMTPLHRLVFENVQSGENLELVFKKSPFPMEQIVGDALLSIGASNLDSATALFTKMQMIHEEQNTQKPHIP